LDGREVRGHELKKFGKIGRDISWQAHFLRQNISYCKSRAFEGAKSR
jgi:hypothetical protein